MDQSSPFFSILIITLLAALVPLLATRKRLFPLPIVIGEILAGMLIGKNGFNLVTPSPILEFLSEFGFVFLMFLSGLEVDLSVLTDTGESHDKPSVRRNPLFLSLIHFCLTLVGSFGVAYGLRHYGLVESPFILGLILSTTSLGIVLPILKERGIISSKYGQQVLLSALVADFATLVLLSIAFAFLKKGGGLQLFLLLLFLTAVALSLRFGIKMSRSKTLQKIFQDLSRATAHIRVRGAIALMVAWVSLAHVLGTEVILGAFIAGIIVNILAGKEESVLRDKLDVLGFGFFIPFFFIMVGSRFDWQILVHSRGTFILFPLLIGAAYLVKLIPSLLFRLGFGWRESISAGFLLSSRLSLIIAASAVALQLGVINEGLNATIVLMAMVTCTLSPVLFSRFATSLNELERKGIIVAGINPLTALLIDRLKKEGETVFLLGCPEVQASREVCQGIRPDLGDPNHRAALEKAGAGQAAAIVVALDDGEVNLEICQLAKEFGIPLMISRTDDFMILEKMKALGVRVIQPVLANAIALEGALRFPTIFDFLADHGDDVEIGEAVLNNPQLEGLPLRHIRLPGNSLVIGIRRKGEVIVPHGDTTFFPKDVVMLLGNANNLNQAKILLGKPRPIKSQKG